MNTVRQCMSTCGGVYLIDLKHERSRPKSCPTPKWPAPRSFSWAHEGSSREPDPPHDALNMTPAGVARRPSCKSCSRTCRPSKRSTSNLQCASPSTRSSEFSQRRPLARSQTCLGKHPHPARDVGLSWKHHSRYPRGSAL